MSNRVQIIFDAVNRTEKSVKAIESDIKGLGSVVSGVSKAFVALGGVIGTMAVGRAVGDLIDVKITLEKIHNALLAATGSAEAAEAEFGFVRSEARRLGLDLETAAQGFAQLAASAKGTGISGQQVREIFTAVGEASTVMGMSAADSAGAIRALSQIMSKGTVQAEELRGQLGERIPGAFRIAAEAMGKTTAELNKMLEQGQVLSDEFLPKFAAQMRQQFSGALPAAMESTQVGISRLNTAWFELKAGIADIPVVADMASDGIEALSGSIDRLRKAIASTKEEDLEALNWELQNTLEQMTAREGYPEWMQKFWGDLEGHADELREKIAALKKEMGEPAPSGTGGSNTGAGGGTGKSAAQADQLRKTLSALQLDIDKSGLNQFDAKIADINFKADELKQKFGELETIEVWRKNQIGAVETERELALLKIGVDDFDSSIVDSSDALAGFVQTLNLTGDTMGEITAGLTLFGEQSSQLSSDIDELGNHVGVTFEDMSTAVEGWGSSFSAQLNDAAWAADASFASILNSFVRMLTQMVIQKTVVEPILGAGLSFLGGLFGPVGSVATAAVSGTFSSSIDASSFSLGVPAHHAGGKFVAPMFHAGGLAGDEGFAVLKKGEVVFDPDQTKLVEGLSKLGARSFGASQVNVTLIESSDRAGQVTQQQDGPNLNVDVFVEQIRNHLGREISEGRGLARPIREQFGLNNARGRF